MPDVQASTPLSPEDSARLTEFARAFKAAARAVLLYPTGHPAISLTLRRVVEITSIAQLSRPLKITVLPSGLLLNDRAPARADSAVAELAELLHSHLIGALTVHAGGDLEAWRSFLLLVGRTPDALRAEGGIARTWATTAGQHVELREIDYAEVLRERTGGTAAGWDRVIANCLSGHAFDLDEDAIRDLLDVAVDAERLTELLGELDARAGYDEVGIGAKTAALLRMLRGIVEAVTKSQPERLEPVLQNMAAAVSHLSPDTLLDLLSERVGEPEEGARLVKAVVSRMSEGTIARFVARNVMASSTPTDRLAEAFQALVQDTEDRRRMLTLAHRDVAQSPLGNTDGFEGVWTHVAERLLTSYSDTSYVSQDYGHELSGARTRAIDVEHAGDDPPERISAWLTTVATSALRALDLTLVLDLLRIEERDDRWGELMTPTIVLLEDLLLVGDFDAGAQLVEVLVREAAAGTSMTRRQHALTAVDMLVAGPMMRHIVTHLATIDDAPFEQVKAMCVSLGEVLVKPLAEALSVEERSRPRQRLTSILLAFGVIGKRTVERLKGSPNPAVRRTAIYLLREFGGSDALPDLTELLDDNEPQVQREAVRAILNIGTERAYQVLKQALATGTAVSRERIMQAMMGMRDERATPLFAYILRHTNHRGSLAPVYLRAIESLGLLRDPDGIQPLKEALYRGEWWAPRRSAMLRSAAAAALARVGTAEAQAVLAEAAVKGSRGVRSAARQHLDVDRADARGGHGEQS